MDGVARFVHEWRDDADPYRAGPGFAIDGGRLSVGGKAIASVPIDRWMEIAVSAALGARAQGRWHLRVNDGDKTLLDEDVATLDPRWKRLDWLGFVSDADADSTICLDDLDIASR